EVAAGQVVAGLAALGVENDRLYGDVRAALDTVKAAQERLVQTEKSRALGGVGGGIAHEFNNILALILGKTQLPPARSGGGGIPPELNNIRAILLDKTQPLLARWVDETVREGLGHVDEAAWRAADIIRRLQGFAATRLDDTDGPIDVNTLVHDAVTLTRGLWKDEAERRGVRMEGTMKLED